MQIKNLIGKYSDFRFVLESLKIKTSLAKSYLYAQKFCTNYKQLENEFAAIERVISFLIDDNYKTIFLRLNQKMSQVLDINTTVQNLANSCVLGDVELFEIKKLSLIACDISKEIRELQLINLPDLSEVVDILDPEKSRVATFYIYNAYSSKLTDLRKQMKICEVEKSSEIFAQASQIEDEIRADLSKKLQPHSQNLQNTLQQIAYLDLLIAKTKQALDNHFCKPKIVDTQTKYTALFNPQIKNVLAQKNKQYQAVDIVFSNMPTLISGINMGGKTVCLKTLALSQCLCQFGFYVPAQQAEIALVDDVVLCTEDEQNPLQGLSSFAAEMLTLNEILNQSKINSNILILIDELARSTNPVEGKAIVAAVLEMLAECGVQAFITTHYDVNTNCCRRLRVKGFKSETKNIDVKNIEEYIDYSLVEDSDNTAPREALRIAEMLGVNAELIERARKNINSEKN